MNATDHATRQGRDYDVIVVGARCAGSPTAMLLARRGYRVLVVDRASFPSDTVSTHLLHAPAVAALRRWGLLDEVLASGCPPIERYAIDFGPFTIAGTCVSTSITLNTIRPGRNRDHHRTTRNRMLPGASK